MSNRIKIAGYCRVSTDNQKDEGTINLQETALREFADANGYEITAIFKDEGVSGGLEARPGLTELFNYLEDEANAGVTGVLIYKLDRLARDLYIQEGLIKQLEKLDKTLISTKERDLDSHDPMRKAFRQFMGIVSELEKAFITMRLSGGRISKAHKGKYAGGGVALGYQAKSKELKVDNSNADTIRQIFSMKRYKRLGLRQIARLLNEQGNKTARGGLWHAGTVKYILANPIYKGKIEYKGISTKRPDLAILSPANS